jgi:hypothetical protein
VNTVTEREHDPENYDEREPNEEEPHRFRFIDNSESFGPQPTSTADLPDPAEFARTLVGGIIECVHGLREPIQFTRHVTDDVYRALSARVHRLHVADQQLHGSKRKKKVRPQFTLGNVVINNPRDGIVEASVVVHGPARVRAVALRIEGLDQRWQATSFSML